MFEKTGRLGLKSLWRLSPRLLIVWLCFFALSCLTLPAVAGIGYYMQSLGINTHSDRVEAGGHYYSVGTGFRTEITKQQFDAWRLCERWIIATFILGALTMIPALCIGMHLWARYGQEGGRST